jgi:hypothetical protein
MIDLDYMISADCMISYRREADGGMTLAAS